MGWLSFLSAVPVALDVVDRLRANPKGRVRALHQLKKESEENHQRTLAQMETARQSYEESVRRSQERADEELRAQKEENRKALELIKNQANEKEKEHDEAVRQMNEDHENKMSEMRSATKEARDKAELDHKMKMIQLEKKHDSEKKEVKEQLEKIKEEGEKKIKEVERQKEEIALERYQELEDYNQKMIELEEGHSKENKAILERQKTLRLENSKERREQMQIEHKKTLEAIKQSTETLLQQITMNSSRDVIEQFKNAVEPFADVRNALQQITSECEDGHVEPGVLDPDIDDVKTKTAIFRNRMKQYRQFVINTHRADRNVFDVCTKYTNTMDKLIRDTELLNIVNRLPKAIDADDTDKVVLYGKKAEQLFDGFNDTTQALENEIREWQQRHLPVAKPLAQIEDA